MASAHGAFPELITPDLTGRSSHPPMSMPSSASSPTSRTIRNGGTDTARRARQTYRSRFSPDVGIARLLEIYRFAVEHPIERSESLRDVAETDRVALPSGCRRDHDRRRKQQRPPRPQSRKHGLIQAVRRLGWGVADQGISSLSNFALGLFVARSFGASNFGAFTLAYITYTVVINALAVLATDPLLVRYSGDASRRWRRATSAATGTALAVGVAAGVLCIVAGLLLPDPVGPVFIALGRRATGACSAGQLAVRVLRLRSRVVRIRQRPVLDRAARSRSCRAARLGETARPTVCSPSGALQRWLPCWGWFRPGHCHAHSARWLAAMRTARLSVRYLVENVSISGASQLRSFMCWARSLASQPSAMSGPLRS